ncbi:outer membrane porin, OprD family, partial [Pseudomonas sp. HMWF010]
TFTGGRLDKVIDRASSNSEELILNSKNRRFAAGITADHLDLMGFDYEFAKGLSGRYYFADLDDIYRQHFFGLLASQPLGSGTLSADVRMMLSKDSGASNAGKIDNRAFNAMLTYAINGHKLGLGFQDMSGDTGYAYIDGSDPFLVNFVQINDFANADERSWQARYDYDFGKLGVPGLSFMTRYIKGSDAHIAGTDDTGGEWERDIEVKYVVQSGPLKDVYVRLRNASFKSDFARDADENRVIVGYTLPIW